jgi:hypothetical protein
MATAVKGKAAPVQGVAFGDLDLYTSGGGLPEGDYVWKDLTVQMYQGTDKQGVSKGPSRLGVMITLVPLDGGEERVQFYSMGSKAHESFQPNPETGKGVIPVPGGPASTFNNSTNWALLLKSLTDSGLPKGIFTDNCSVLEGIHVHMHHIAEPAGRAGFQSQTGEAAADRKPGTIAVVSEIKDDGKPWEGTGGIPEAAPAKANGNAAPVKTVAKAPVKTAPAPAEPEEAGDDSIQAAAEAGAAVVLGKNEAGCAKLILRTGTFKAVNEAHGQEMATAVINTYFSSDAKLNELLGPLGFAVKGSQVVAV